jgi:hypothetical protein
MLTSLPPYSCWRLLITNTFHSAAESYTCQHAYVLRNSKDNKFNVILTATSPKPFVFRHMLTLYSQAQAFKLKLETKNSMMCKKVTETGESAAPAPRWFELRAPDALTWTPGEQLRWRYKGGYWAARAAKKWDGIPTDFFES